MRKHTVKSFTTRNSKTRFAIFKDYYCGDINFTDTWVVIYGTQAEAEAAKARLDAGQDKSWFDPSPDNDEQAFLYVDQIEI